MKPFQSTPDSLRQLFSYLVIRFYQDMDHTAGNGIKQTIPIISERLNVSQATLARACLEIYQQSPIALKQEFMMQRAKEQIQRGNKPMQVYPLFGYKTYNGFAKAFRKVMHHAPTQITK